MSTASTTIPEHRDARETEVLTLLERIGGGDHAAVAECIARYGDLVWHLARRFSATSADAEDATQDIFLEVWQKAHTFDRRLGSEETFLAMIARRRLIDRRRRSLSGVSTVGGDLEQIQPMTAAPVDEVELRDEAAKAERCMEKLSPEQHSVLSMSIHHGHSHHAISQCLNIPLGTVKSFARRGLLQLRDCMNRNFSIHAGIRST